MHCITPRNQLYVYEVDGVPFIDWLTAYAAGEAVTSVHCQDCKQTYSE
jgi:hypothetical protein